jgi:hypothetical protein
MNKKAEYLGNCIESFDENGISNIEIYDNTSDFALAEEDATVINLNKFIEITKLSTSDISHFITNDNIYLYDENTKSAFIYNDIEDVHYIFKVNNHDISMDNSPLDKIIKIENEIDRMKTENYRVLFHSGDSSRNEDLKFGIEPQFGDWLKEVLSGAIDDDEEMLNTIIDNEHNQTCFFSEDPSWVSIKAQRAKKDKNSLQETTIEDIINHGQLCIVFIDEEEDEQTFKRAGSKEDDYVEKSTYLFSNEIADYEIPFGVERGDIYSHDSIEPNHTLTGVELVGFLARNYPKSNILKENIELIFKDYPEFDNTSNNLKNDIENLINKKEDVKTPKKINKIRKP